MSHESLLKRLVPIGKSVTPILPPTGLSEQEIRNAQLRNGSVDLKLRRQAQMAHARAVAAENRRLGITPKKKRGKRAKMRRGWKKRLTEKDKQRKSPSVADAI